MKSVLKHSVILDSCVRDEVEYINNVLNILTLESCCGHGRGNGIIYAIGTSAQKMLYAGYKVIEVYKLTNKPDGVSVILLCGFKPKSICSCSEKLKG